MFATKTVKKRARKKTINSFAKTNPLAAIPTLAKTKTKAMFATKTAIKRARKKTINSFAKTNPPMPMLAKTKTKATNAARA